MSEAQPNIVRGDEPKLDDVILYLLAKHATESGYKIPISDVHQLIETVEHELQTEFGLSLRFHESSQHVHSQQVEKALGDIIPYKLPVRNPSFSLEITGRIGEKVLERTAASLSDDQITALDRMSENADFQETLSNLSVPAEGG